ncbi:hypothetical protein EYC80_000698 [Monilinia laxa]|uniref:Uncharacterized protein n=1 Tax=Monilinia laxa TaxID=61186 RepID=A0A5N6KBK1_MONLA|nr:hypothetical protein EYC80_000698 [Monilinia laxa]
MSKNTMTGSVDEVQPEPLAEAKHAIVQTTTLASIRGLWEEALDKIRKDDSIDVKRILDKDWKFEEASDGSEKVKEMFENARYLEKK